MEEIFQKDDSLWYNQPENIAAPHPLAGVGPIFWYGQEYPQKELSEYVTIVLIHQKAVIPYLLIWRG